MALTDSLSRYYRFNQTSGAVTNLLTNNQSSFPQVGGVYTTGKIGNGIDLGLVNGTGNVLGTGAFSGFGYPPSETTISFWMKLNTEPGVGEDAYILNARDNTYYLPFGPAHYGYLRITYENNGGTPRIVVNFNNSITTADYTFGTSDWHNVVITWTAGTGSILNFYIDDTLIVSGTYSNVSTSSGTGSYLGNSGDLNKGLAAQFDELGNWSRVLYASEITQLYNSGAGLTYPFTSPPAPPAAGTLQSLIVAAGGSGGAGASGTYPTGGGGAGGCLEYSIPAVLAAGVYPIVVGQPVNDSNGGNSSFNGQVAIGGGVGGRIASWPTYISATSGGSGGGGGWNSSNVGQPGAAGTAGQGYAGSSPGGGGGKMSTTGTRVGGTSLWSWIKSNSYPTAFAGGGAAGGDSTGFNEALGGIDSGGNSIYGYDHNGEPNTGGGGAGGGYPNSSTRGQGASGVVVLRYKTSEYPVCTGGIITTDGLYTVHTFGTSGNFRVAGAPPFSGALRTLVVAGGGGGGSVSTKGGGGGGGGGGVIENDSLAVPDASYPVIVGTGGPVDTNGQDSSFYWLNSKGGGKGGTLSVAAAIGGSGGGAGSPQGTGTVAGAAGTLGQGNSGGGTTKGLNWNSLAGGGGGSDGAGANGTSSGSTGWSTTGVGGSGMGSNITGVVVNYAGGGGGGESYGQSAIAAGGIGGGGTGANGGTQDGSPSVAVAGTNGLGGGGGGAAYWSSNYAAAAGGSGVVIIRYETSLYGVCTGGVKTVDGLYTVHTFTTSDAFVMVGSPFLAHKDTLRISEVVTVRCGYPVELLAVGGGGQGGGVGGGGGAGGFYHTFDFILPASMPYYNVIIGSGGYSSAYNAVGQNGGNTSFDTTIAYGGGGGGNFLGIPDTAVYNGAAGGSGGGGTGVFVLGFGGLGLAGQGYSGGWGFFNASGGGGGAGAAGEWAQIPPTPNVGGDGGIGMPCSISSTSGVKALIASQPDESVMTAGLYSTWGSPFTIGAVDVSGGRLSSKVDNYQLLPNIQLSCVLYDTSIWMPMYGVAPGTTQNYVVMPLGVSTMEWDFSAFTFTAGHQYLPVFFVNNWTGLESWGSYGTAGGLPQMLFYSVPYYAGGGGGGGSWMLLDGDPIIYNGAGGQGGGAGGSWSSLRPANAIPNTGGGGGGGGYFDIGSPQYSTGSFGGSGIVIIRLKTANFISSAGGTITHEGDYTIHTFTTTGTFGMVPVPPEPEPEPETCSSFTYSDWGVCSPEGQHTRTVIDASPEGCEGGDPVLVEDCVPPVPPEFLYCSVNDGYGLDMQISEEVTVDSTLADLTGVFDLIELSEEIAIYQYYEFLASSDIYITEDLTILQFTPIPPIGSDVYLSEEITVENPQLGDINVGEDILISEDTVNEGQLGDIDIQENLDVAFVLFNIYQYYEFLTFDLIQISETLVAENKFCFGDTTSSISLSEDIVNSGQLGDINVFDTLNLSEFTDELVFYPVIAGDDLNLSEVILIENPLPDISFVDSINITDDVFAIVNNELGFVDNILITEDFEVAPPLFDFEIWVRDNIQISEYSRIGRAFAPDVDDTIEISEEVTVTPPIFGYEIFIIQSIYLSEDPAQLVQFYECHVSSIISLTEVLTMEAYLFTAGRTPIGVKGRSL